MTDLNLTPDPDKQDVRRKHEESNTMLAIIMAGMGALFIIAVVLAYNYSASTSSTATSTSTSEGGSGICAWWPRAPVLVIGENVGSTNVES